ncbi:hypothetical protein Mal15_44210 [Stieleria maiorica]|uniref:Uncharacterized protein n=1 Tax=Stieleria maiorica TaxID=2795974 RepID=A0A5B9MK41_9BACT|nr:hypothetical protein Mal15_44210 [Stieleria maiorica]
MKFETDTLICRVTLFSRVCGSVAYHFKLAGRLIES